MNWLRLSIVVLGLSSITWSYECPDGAMNCQRCKKYGDGQIDILCSSSHGVGFEVSIQPNELVSFNCLGNPNWMDFDLEMKNPIKIITSAINIKNCNLPKTGLAAVMKEFNGGRHRGLYRVPYHRLSILALNCGVFIYRIIMCRIYLKIGRHRWIWRF